MREFGIHEVAVELKMRTESRFPGFKMPLIVYKYFCRRTLRKIREVVREEKGRIFFQNCHIRQIYKDHNLEEARGKLIEDGI